MAFSRIVEILSSAASRLSAIHSPAIQPSSSGFLPQPDHSSRLTSPDRNSNFQFSSSHQDFSAYRRLDPEEGDLDIGDRRATYAKLPRALHGENAGSSFSKEKALPGTPFIRKKWVRAIIFLLCLLLFIFLVYMCAIYFSTNWLQKSSKFYVVLDCGSTGTRVYVYQSSINHKKDGNLPIAMRSLPEGLLRKYSSQNGRAYHRMETEPGFDKLVYNISGLKAAIKPLLRWAEKQVPKHAHKTTSLFLYATAGVRRLPSSYSEWLLDNAWSIMKNSSFLCRRDWVKIITGTEEAYYGWIALNYHTGMLGAVPTKSTVGSLDLGGSSLQITFETKELVHDETSLNLSIGSINHHLSAYSLEGYGLNDAFDKSVVRLLKSLPEVTNADLINGNIELRHPCLQSGYKEQYICSQCVSISQGGESPLIGGRKTGKRGKPGIAVQLIGAPNWHECSSLAKVTVNLSEWSDLNPGIDCELQPCALTNSLPRPRGKFYAMSGFHVVYRFFNLTPEATLDDVLQKGQEFCGKNWNIARKSVAPQPFIEQYCFRAPYIVSLLREGLHIKDSHVVIGSGSITWTLGVALLEAGGAFLAEMELQSYKIFHMKMNPSILFASLILSLFLLVCALACGGNWLPRFFRRPYLQIFRHNNSSTTSVLNMPSPFRFQRWSPISSGDGRVKMPLSPTTSGSNQRPFSMGHGLGGSSIQLMESSFHPSTSSISHSYSSGNLGQMHFDNGGMGSFWTPHRSQMRLQSRRSQSREDLNSSLAESHMVKV